MTDYNYNVNPQQQPNPYGSVNPDAGKSDKRVFGLWGLWLGIGGIILAFGLPSVAAVVMGIVALVKEPRSKGLGIWGIVLGALGLIWTFLLWTIIVPLLVLWAIVESVPSISPYTTY